jgi:hypothetical protein
MCKLPIDRSCFQEVLLGNDIRVMVGNLSPYGNIITDKETEYGRLNQVGTQSLRSQSVTFTLPGDQKPLPSLLNLHVVETTHLTYHMISSICTGNFILSISFGGPY